MEFLNESVASSLNNSLNVSLNSSLNSSFGVFDASMEEKENPLSMSPRKRVGKKMARGSKASPLSRAQRGSPRHWKAAADDAAVVMSASLGSELSELSANESSLRALDESAQAVEGGAAAVALVEKAFLEMESQLRALERRPRNSPLRNSNAGTPVRESTPVAPGSPFKSEVDKARQLHDTQVELAKALNAKSKALEEVEALRAQMSELSKARDESNGMVVSLTSQITDRMNDIAELEAKVTHLQRTLASVQQGARDAARERTLKRKLNASLKSAFALRGMTPLSEEGAALQALQTKYDDIKRRYFYFLALAVKLNYALAGVSVNSMDSGAVFEELVDQGVDESEWPARIAAYFEASLANPSIQ